MGDGRPIDDAIRAFALAAKATGQRNAGAEATQQLQGAHRALVEAIDAAGKERAEAAQHKLLVDLLHQVMLQALPLGPADVVLEGLSADEMRIYRRAFTILLGAWEKSFPAAYAAAFARLPREPVIEVGVIPPAKEHAPG